MRIWNSPVAQIWRSERGPFGVPPSEEGRSGELGPPPGVFREIGGPGDDPPPPPYEVSRQNGSPSRRWWPRLLIAGAILLILFILANIGIGLYVDRLWFDEVGYRGVFNTRLGTQVWLFFAGFGIAFATILTSMALAWRLPLQTSGEPISPFRELSLASVQRMTLVVGALGALFLAIILGSVASAQWEQILQFIHAEPFGIEDPEFGRDAGFYIFKLEALQFIKGWAIALTLLATIAAAAVYGYRLLLYSGNAEATRAVRLHLAVQLATVVGLFVLGYWLARFELVVSENGTVFGATYADANARSPIFLVMMAVGTLTAAALVSWPFHRRLVAPAGTLAALVIVSIGGGLIYPAIVQRVTVDPNELRRESQFIARNIEATRFAFGLHEIEERQFSAEDAVTPEDAASNPETLRNIRLWDHRPLRDILNNRQTIRPLYIFPDVDVDRYKIDGESRQVFLAARELTHANLAPSQQGWVNQRLQFTHGFGVTMSPVDLVTEAGEPDYFISNIPPEFSDVIAQSSTPIAITQPRIYFGEATAPYVIVNSDSEEFDFPLTTGADDSGTIITEAQARNRYDGTGGIELGGFFKQLAFAWEFGDTNILISGSVQTDSRILFRRNIQDRVHELAPFLQLDADPYVVIGNDGELYWIQDAYTTTTRYPYSQPHTSGLNYIRNSVKIVVNAYHGSVDFYLVDPTDPIAQVWSAIFPDLFQPAGAFPADLRAHWRYPQDLFQVQADQYLTYHIVQPDTLFNREDIWAIPQETLRDQTIPVEPYYVTVKLPDSDAAEFLLILPFTPNNRQNAIAWFAGRSDGENYGHLFAFRFPRSKNVDGPTQVEARIGQEPDVSTLFTLLGQEGSSIIRGNLLFIPVGESYIYVEPIYVEAELTSFPQLKFVVLVNGDTIALEETLEEAAAVALRSAPSTPRIPQIGGRGEGTGTPRPPAAAGGVEVSDSIVGLIAEAQDAYADAKERLAAADFAGYGEQLERLEQAVERLSDAVGEPP